MSKEIKINIEALEETLENLRNASATFETYSTEFIGKARNCMDGFQDADNGIAEQFK